MIVLNRIKVHTALVGDMQSGLTKMCVVGLGGPSGAQQFHSLGIRELPACLREIGTILIEKTPILGGLAIIENGFEETAHIIGVEARKFIEEEPKLLATAMKLMPLLPADKLDILVIEEMGKDYSGTCIDTNCRRPFPGERRAGTGDALYQAHCAAGHVRGLARQCQWNRAGGSCD